MQLKSIQVTLLFIAFALTFLWLNADTAMSVAPWIDEVMQVDAAVNLYFGNSWVSTAWPSQSQYQFWAANNPLYTLLVYFWISIFGFAPVIVRSLNYVLALAIAWLIADTSQRMGWVRSTWARSLLVVLLACGQGFSFVYRSGRADLVTMLVVVLLLWTYFCVADPIRRRFQLGAIALLLVPSGLQSIPYAALLLGLEYLFSRKLRLPDLTAIGLGCAVGGLILAALFAWNQSLTAYISQTYASGYNMVGAVFQATVVQDSAAISRMQTLIKALSPASVLQTIAADTSVLPLIIFLSGVLLLLWRDRNAEAIPAAIAGLTAAILIPYGMLVAGRYPIYYEWMGAAPLALCFTAALERVWNTRKYGLVSFGIAAAITSILLGMPSVVWREVQKTPPAEYSAIDRILRDEVRPGEVIYGDPVMYYAAKMAGIRFFSTSYAGGRGYPRMTEEERSHISVLIVAPGQAGSSFEKLGGGWTRLRAYRSPYGSTLAIYRRTKTQTQ